MQCQWEVFVGYQWLFQVYQYQVVVVGSEVQVFVWCDVDVVDFLYVYYVVFVYMFVYFGGSCVWCVGVKQGVVFFVVVLYYEVGCVVW